MLVYEHKLDGNTAQYTAIDEAIRVTQFVAKSGKAAQISATTGIPQSQRLAESEQGQKEAGQSASEGTQAA